MKYIIVKDNSAKKFVDTLEEYKNYIITNYISASYIQNIDIKELNNSNYLPGLYIIDSNDNKILIVEKTITLYTGYLFNSHNININIKHTWSLIINDIDEDICLDVGFDNILNNYLCKSDKFINTIDSKNFNMIQIKDCHSLLLANKYTDIEYIHDIIEYIMDKYNIGDSELYIHINTPAITIEKFPYSNIQIELNIEKLCNDLLSTYTKKILVLELNESIINNDIIIDIINNKKQYNLFVIGIVDITVNINNLQFDTIIRL